jgi:hypothetical protein
MWSLTPTSSRVRLPSSRRLPLATATTFPSFIFAVCEMESPPTVPELASMTFKTIQPLSGRIFMVMPSIAYQTFWSAQESESPSYVGGAMRNKSSRPSAPSKSRFRPQPLEISPSAETTLKMTVCKVEHGNLLVVDWLREGS